MNLQINFARIAASYDKIDWKKADSTMMSLSDCIMTRSDNNITIVLNRDHVFRRVSAHSLTYAFFFPVCFSFIKDGKKKEIEIDKIRLIEGESNLSDEILKWWEYRSKMLGFAAQLHSLRESCDTE